jgi:3-phytase
MRQSVAMRHLIVCLLGALAAVVLVVLGPIRVVDAADVATPVEAETFDVKPTGTRVVTDTTLYSNGQALKFSNSKAIAKEQVNFASSGDVVLMARAGQTGGSPKLRVSVNGTFTAAAQAITNSGAPQPYTFDVNAPSGSVTIGVKAANTGSGRQPFVDIVSFPASGSTPDTTAPETTITSGPTGTVSSGSASFTFSSSEAGSTFECALDGEIFGACASPKQYTNLASGEHTFQVRATDAAGNVDATPASRTWTVGDVISATVETDPVPHSGDAADDAAIWVNRHNRSLSTIIGTDKQGGLMVFNLNGRQIQYLPVGRANNVDSRSDVDVETGFVLGGETVSLVTAGNRTDDSIGIYKVVADTRQLQDVAARVINTGIQTYGSCMYRSPSTGKFYYFVNSRLGEVEQWELFDNGAGKVDAVRVRSFSVGSSTEGCVADDKLGHFYIGEEGVGIWKYGAEPDAGTERTLVDSTGSAGHLVADVEGLTISYSANGTGYLIASSQGNSSFVVYKREGSNDYVKTFKIEPGNGIDGVEDTDGIDVTTMDLGPDFPSGVFVAQDGKNDIGYQNFKLVPYQRIFPNLP